MRKYASDILGIRGLPRETKRRTVTSKSVKRGWNLRNAEENRDRLRWGDVADLGARRVQLV